jgi:hypothetical protein
MTRPLSRLSLSPVLTLSAQLLVPGAVLLFAAWRDRSDGKPAYVIPWIVFSSILAAAWLIPVPRSNRFGHVPRIPFWVWTWLACLGVLAFTR